MATRLLRDAFGWGIGIWLTGYVLGGMFRFLLPSPFSGWLLLLLLCALMLRVLSRVRTDSFKYFLTISLVWTLLAFTLDYLFNIVLGVPARTFYHLTIYLYYLACFILPICMDAIGKSAGTPPN